MDEKIPDTVMHFEHSSGQVWWYHRVGGELHAEMLPRNCSWKLLANGDLIITTEIRLAISPIPTTGGQNFEGPVGAENG